MMRHVDLAKAHFFPDITPMPERFKHVHFDIELYDEAEGDGDWAVSYTIDQLGIWEPMESILMLSAFAGNPSALFIDIGAHVGWYTLLARAFGLRVLAVDAVERNLKMIEARADDEIAAALIWINSSFHMDLAPIQTIVKMDIEGAEQYAVKALAKNFTDGSITHALIEMSPVFNISYPHIANTIIGKGYECWVLPGKQTPPPEMGDTRPFLETHCLGLHGMPEKMRRRWINDQHQFNAMFCREDAKWG